MAGILAALCLVPAAPADEARDPFSVRRFMLAIGTNDGGAERVRLRYADRDARAVAKVFEELGGIEAEDRLLLLNPDRTALRGALAELGQRIAGAKPRHSRTELVVYYSGHSDEHGLLLGPERYDYAELRAAVDRLPADVRIIILDSCASGAFTRLKGGKRRAPFLVDASAQMKGHAFLTSSSDAEASQESDRIEASFFTHALVSGLRGAADVSADNRVTLNEAYQYAFHSTLARTAGTRSGPQHPAYDIQMVGAGDLVMTDLRGTSAGLTLKKEMSGRLHVRDSVGVLVVEVEKPRGRAVELGLEPGDYRVILDRDGHFYGGRLSLAEGGRTELEMAQLTPIAAELTTARGAEIPAVRDPGAAAEDLLYREFSFSVIPGIGSNGRSDYRTISQVSFNLTLGRNGGVNGFEAGYIGNLTLGDVKGCQMAGMLNLVEGSMSGFQGAGFLNRVWGDVEDVQLAGLVNSVGGNLNGVQGAGLVNAVEGEGRYLQAAGLACWTRRTFAGVQMAGLATLGTGHVEGAQLAGLACAAVSVRGLQGSGSVNLVREHIEGAQLSGAFNGAASLRGAQVSVVNLVGDADGCQIGVVNLARRVHGAQIGLVNVADQVDGAPIGLVSLVRRGRHNVAFWGGNPMAATIGVKLGNDRVYSIFAAGTESISETVRQFYGLGLGVSFPAGRFFADVDLLTHYIHESRKEYQEGDGQDDDLHLLNQGRLSCGWQVAPRLALVAGGMVNVYTSRRNNGADFADGAWKDDRIDGTWVKIWPGFFFGIQI